eukprot:1141653-Pelagomonas_calceolata.AAC.5
MPLVALTLFLLLSSATNPPSLVLTSLVSGQLLMVIDLSSPFGVATVVKQPAALPELAHTVSLTTIGRAGQFRTNIPHISAFGQQRYTLHDVYIWNWPTLQIGNVLALGFDGSARV